MNQMLIHLTVPIIVSAMLSLEKGCLPTMPPELNRPSATKDPVMEPENKDSEPPIPQTERQWKQKLTRAEYTILREKGTERPFAGKYDHFFEPGIYRCAGCGNELFVSDTKYNSGCGWPAFSSPADESAVTESPDTSLDRVRTEITCGKCGGHLGHLFNDGPAPTGLRYCVNSAALDFEKQRDQQ